MAVLGTINFRNLDFDLAVDFRILASHVGALERGRCRRFGIASVFMADSWNRRTQ